MKHSSLVSIARVAGLCVAGFALALLSACGGGSSNPASDAGGSAAAMTINEYTSDSYSYISSGSVCKEPSCKPYTTDMKVKGWFSVGSALPANSKTNLMDAAYSTSLMFQFDDGGYNTFDNFNKKNAAVKVFLVSTDQDGKIVDFTIDLQSPRDVPAGSVFSDLKVWRSSSSALQARAWNQLLCPMAINGICNYDPTWSDNPTFGGWALSGAGTWTSRVSSGLG